MISSPRLTPRSETHLHSRGLSQTADRYCPWHGELPVRLTPFSANRACTWAPLVSSVSFHSWLLLPCHSFTLGSRVCLLPSLFLVLLWGQTLAPLGKHQALCVRPPKAPFLSSSPGGRSEGAHLPETCSSTIHLKSEHPHSWGTKLSIGSSQSKELPDT